MKNIPAKKTIAFAVVGTWLAIQVGIFAVKSFGIEFNEGFESLNNVTSIVIGFYFGASTAYNKIDRESEETQKEGN